MWITEVEDLLNDHNNPLALQMGGKLMDLSHNDGIDNISYPEGRKRGGRGEKEGENAGSGTNLGSSFITSVRSNCHD